MIIITLFVLIVVLQRLVTITKVLIRKKSENPHKFEHWSVERHGQRIEMDNFIVYRFRNGQIVERWEFVDDKQDHDVFWCP